MTKLVLVRHGESAWNAEGRFTGWADIDLTEEGIVQMRRAGQALVKAGMRFDLAVTSMLKRAIRSQRIILEACDQVWLPVVVDWRANERHYGALTGLRKADAEQCFGHEQVQRWRRDYWACPPAIDADDPAAPARDLRYRPIPVAQLPLAESLADTAQRVRALWEGVLAPELRGGKRVLVTAHGNSLRALISLIEPMSPARISNLEIPNGVPFVYELTTALAVERRYPLPVPLPKSDSIL